MTQPPVAVVLAGGRSTRFGSDKLQAAVGELSLLERTLAGLPPVSEVIVVGPERPLVPSAGPMRFVREDPPYAGPTAALLSGLRAGLAAGADQLVVLPGDAPGAGVAVERLLAAIDRTSAGVVVATDAHGRLQPLQLAVSRAGARQLLDAAGPAAGRNASARALVTALEPPAERVEVPAVGWFDVDTVEQLAVHRSLPAARAVLAAADARAESVRRPERPPPKPVVVALDGPSRAGKSTLAAAVALCRLATVLDGDDFYSPALPALSAAQRNALTGREIADRVIDWRRLRAEALEPLVRGESAQYRPYDWAAGDGRLGPPKQLRPADLLVVEGVYSGRAELADLVDVSVYVEIDASARADRLARRTDDPPEWVRFWERGEQAYFAGVRRPEGFDLRLRTDPVDPPDFRNAPGT
jgi:molybdopterin-guanine dinucleotide biosynthesis protein A/uridine kinase